MREIKRILLVIFILVIFTPKAFSSTAWINDLRSLFLSKNAVIYAVNIRTFNAKDGNKNGIIEEDLGEERGTFLNAIDRLDSIAAMGINTLHLLPVNPVGKIKAQGTAGSLYSISSFDEINPQLKSPKSKLTINDEMKMFVDECHRRNIRVIVDLPACGSYDLYLKNPDLFKKDKDQNPIIPSDWADVRLLDAGSNEKINTDVYNLYQDFIDLMVGFDVDGIVADVATTKPYSFWKKLIDGTRANNPQFLFLAQASNSSITQPSAPLVMTPYNKLLDAGFDGYYGSYSNSKGWKSAKELVSQVEFDVNLAKKYSNRKSVIGSFATHDDVSPILTNGPQFSKMILWFNSTLPLNPYYIDGFATGDTYLYPLMNKKASKTFTDDEYYFVHRGQLDIFNFSRSLVGKNYEILQEFVTANKFKTRAKDLISNGNFIPLRASSSSVFAYARSYNKSTVIVLGNLDFQKTQTVTVYVPKITPEQSSIPIKISSIPQILKGKIKTDLTPGEIQVLYFESLDLQ